MPESHGTRRSYKNGCRCDLCKAAEATFQRDNRKRRNANGMSTPTTPVVDLRSRISAERQSAERQERNEPPPAHGPVATGVLAEIESLPSFEGRPGLVQLALALARVLDSPGALPQHASAAHRLSETLDKLRKGADSSKSRLASVQRMTGSRKATG